MEAVGTVTDGRGIAAPQMAAHPVEAWDEFGWTPVPGTLNLNAHPAVIDTVRRWPQITERSDKDRTFHLARLGGQDVAVRCYTSTLEVAAPVRLRDTLGLVNGQQVTLTPRVTVSVVVMAHDKRRRWAEQLAEQLGCGIVWDRRNNVWDTARRAWLAYQPDATHHMVIQDDAILCADLTATVQRLVESIPDAPICLSTIRYRLHRHASDYNAHAAAGARWWSSPKPVTGLGLVLPVPDIEPMVAYADGSTIVHDDLKIQRFYIDRGQQFCFPIPSLVDHRPMSENPTLVDGNDASWTDRSAANFVGADRKAAHLDWTVKRPVVTRGPTMATFRHRTRGNIETVRDGTAAERRFTRLARVWERIDANSSPEAAEPEPVTDYSRLKKARLRDLCIERGLDDEGTAAVLRERLTAADAS